MRLAVLSLLLLLAGCASTPTRYERGTAVAPPAPPARPGVGARVVGQPGASRQAVPRSSHKRVLPPAKEPGLWAGDQPRAVVAPWNDRDPLVLNVLLPYALGYDSLEGDKGQTRRCAYIADTLLGVVMTNAERSALSQPERACLAYWLYMFCTNRDQFIRGVREQQSLPMSQRAKEAMTATAQTAESMFRIACVKNKNATPLVERLAKLVEERWDLVDVVHP